MEGEVSCGAASPTVNAASVAKFCVPEGSTCRELKPEVASRQDQLLAKAKIALGCTMSFRDVEMHNVWYTSSDEAKEEAKQVALVLAEQRMEELSEHFPEVRAGQAALKKWYFVPHSSALLKQTGASPDSPMVSELHSTVEKVATQAGFQQCE